MFITGGPHSHVAFPLTFNFDIKSILLSYHILSPPIQREVKKH